VQKGIVDQAMSGNEFISKKSDINIDNHAYCFLFLEDVRYIISSNIFLFLLKNHLRPTNFQVYAGQYYRLLQEMAFLSVFI